MPQLYTEGEIAVVRLLMVGDMNNRGLYINIEQNVGGEVRDEGQRGIATMRLRGGGYE